MKVQNPLIEIRVGSDSDMPKIKAAYEVLNNLGIQFSPRILSAHRTPDRMASEARNLSKNGFRVCMAAAGGSAHLPGMTASETTIPVIGLPVYSSTFWGIDALLSIIQMPDGIPVATLAPGQAENAALFAAQIGSLNLPLMRQKIRSVLNIENPLPVVGTLKPVIGIVRHPENNSDKIKYEEMLSLLKDFGISFTELEHNKELQENIHLLEAKGAIAIISIGKLDRGNRYFDYHGTGITDLPVIGLPCTNEELLKYSNNNNIANMLFQNPTNKGKVAPIALIGVNRFVNAALFVVQIAGLFDNTIRDKFLSYRNNQAEKVIKKDLQFKKSGINGLYV